MFEGWIDLQRTGPVSLAEQLYRQVRNAVQSGKLAPDTRLPSSRMLAQRLGVSRNVVSEAYQLLLAENIVAVRTGAAPIVAAQRQRAPQSPSTPLAVRLSARGGAIARSRDVATFSLDGRFRPGQPDINLFPREAWGRSLRRAARTLTGGPLLYEQAEGLPALRGVLARHLAEARGVQVMPDEILILPTVQSGLALLAQCFADPGDTVWMEEPGYIGARTAFAGLNIGMLPIDAEGADAAGLTSTPRLIYVTPSHQYPTGVRMSLPRRLALLAIARARGALILEDDYDSEFLWRGRPVPALHALSQAGEVAYLGTVAKSLLPGLRLAYLAVPPGLSPSLIQAQRNLGLLANVHAQAALADFIDGGHYRAYLHRISGVYQKRAELLVLAIAHHCRDRVEMAPPNGGLQLVVRFSLAIDDRAIAHALAAHGFSVQFLSGLCLGTAQSGLVVGFSEADPSSAAHFAGLLANALGIGR